MGPTVDMAETVTGMFERFAPGFRDLVVAVRSVPARTLADHNANLSAATSGSAATTCSARSPGRRCGSNPWSTPIPKAYLCSSAAPPGGGVHGMAGYYAARTVLRREFGIRELPSLVP